ncbi:MAG: MerR family transcriptional regulator [Pseudomonadota bacterium]
MNEVFNETHILNSLQGSPEKRYRIGDVSELLDVKPHVIRYWETEFKNFLRTQKSKGGQKLYSSKEVETILNIRKLLYSEGYNISGAKKKLKDIHAEKADGTARLVSRDILVVVREYVEDIRKELLKLKESIQS